ncbi:hypothetical protein ACH4VX_34295 [Streptomyces sp. NPDC020731]|uniref:hypothetical protein n=1 Tax=Streptomyces sp. NPDC020731 TaxID=3365085 RepID=UPI00378E10C3
MAAIGSLIFTAVATYFSAVVAQDQLDQGREDAQRAARAQAALVTYYTTDEGSEFVETHIHVVNRSLDPVTRADLGFLVRSKNTKTYKQLVLTQQAMVGIQLPPCTKADVDARKVVFSQYYDNSGLTLVGSGRTGSVELDHLAFTDADGVRWKRTEMTLEENPYPPPDNTYSMFTPKDAITYKKAEHCGEGS